MCLSSCCQLAKACCTALGTEFWARDDIYLTLIKLVSVLSSVQSVWNKDLVHELACKWHYFCWIKCEHFITWYIKKVILDPCIMYYYLLLSKQRFEHVFYSIWDCISPLLILIVLWTIIHKYLWSLKGVIQRMM